MMLDTFVYDKVVLGMELIEDIDDGRDASIGIIKLVKCYDGTQGSIIKREDLVSRVKVSGFAGSVRQAKQLLSDHRNIPHAPYSNLLFLRTRWRSLDGLLWFPLLKMLYSPNLKRTQWVLSLMNIPEVVMEMPGNVWIRHGHHYFVEII